MPLGSKYDPLTLTRFFYGPDTTLGLLELKNGRILYALEDPWLNNQPNLSCIPDGLYRCVPRRYYRGGYDAWEITGVPGRDLILFHKGNKADDVTGCIVVGTRIVALSAGVLGVYPSAPAFEEMHRQLGELPEWWVRILPFGQMAGATLGGEP